MLFNAFLYDYRLISNMASMNIIVITSNAYSDPLMLSVIVNIN